MFNIHNDNYDMLIYDIHTNVLVPVPLHVYDVICWWLGCSPATKIQP